MDKDPLNMLDKLDAIDEMGYRYYFQFTVTPYDRSVERGLRDKEEIIETFRRLSDRIGKEKVVWRYDPIILNDEFDFAFHREQFSRLCSRLAGYACQCIISFVDKYPKLRTGAVRKSAGKRWPNWKDHLFRCRRFGITVKACCEEAFMSGTASGRPAVLIKH